MKNTTDSNQPCKNLKLNPTPSASADGGSDIVHLGIDQHAESLVVVEQRNACVPKPARSFTRTEKFLAWVGELLSGGMRVVACHEAGPCGYWLCRRLRDMGVECLVVAPKKWAENGRTKTDSRDARVLCERLFQWTGGRTHVFTVVRVPTEEEERHRDRARTRETLIKERKRIAQSGRGIGLRHQVRLRGQWWKGRSWTEIEGLLGELLGHLREILIAIEKRIALLSAELEGCAASKEVRPAGLGALTDSVIAAEVGDYGRFANRRGPGAFFGLVPGEDSSGGRRRQLSITKTGSGMARRYLVEATWRLIRFQPGWHAWEKWRERYQEAPKWRRQQIIVALARQLMIDLWRLRSGATTMERLGWTPAPH
jgi:transposase